MAQNPAPDSPAWSRTPANIRAGAQEKLPTPVRRAHPAPTRDRHRHDRRVAHALDTELEALLATPRAGVPTELIEAQIARVDGYHRARLIQTFRSALGVDVRMFLTKPAVAAFMTERIGENVDLIKTIPPRFHEGLKRRVGEGFAAGAVRPAAAAGDAAGRIPVERLQLAPADARPDEQAGRRALSRIAARPARHHAVHVAVGPADERVRAGMPTRTTAMTYEWAKGRRTVGPG